MRRTRVLLLPALAATLATWLACTVQYGVDRGAAPDASADVVGTPVDAGQETSIDAGPTLAKVPARPTIDDGTEDLRIVLATDWASPLPDGDGGVTEGTLGYDLDNTATCPGTASCTPPENVDLTAQCDGPGGRDNGFARMLKGFGDTAFTSELSADIENGRAGIVTVIENYNGGKNDTKVRAWAVVSTGTQVQLPDGGPDPVRTPTAAAQARRARHLVRVARWLAGRRPARWYQLRRPRRPLQAYRA